MEQPLDYAITLLLLGGSLAVWIRLLERRLAGAPVVEYQPRMQVPWNGIDVIVLGFMALLLQVVAELMVLNPQAAEPRAASVSGMAAMVVSRLVWLLFAMVYLVRASGAYVQDMGFDMRRLGSDLRLAGLTFLAAIIPVYGIQLLLTKGFGFESEHPLVTLVNQQPSTGVLVLASVAAVIVAPLVEEFLFRVVIQGWLERREIERRVRYGGDPDQPAGFAPIIVAGIVFALLHLASGIDWIALFVLSLFLGYVYQRTHRLIAPLAVHFLINALAILQLWRLYLAGPTS